MNKNLFRMAGAVLCLEALYLLYIYSQIYKILFAAASSTSTAIEAITYVLIGPALLIVSVIGTLTVKRWSIITLWAMLIVTFAFSVAFGHSWPALFLYGNIQVWFIDLILAIFLTMEWKRLSA
ncbi:MAG: hypothetical protein KGI45_00960 [Patescibacteria group bacterium]|nr:hypothetical protein [Patescibacteria group bacterium]